MSSLSATVDRSSVRKRRRSTSTSLTQRKSRDSTSSANKDVLKRAHLIELEKAETGRVCFVYGHSCFRCLIYFIEIFTSVSKQMYSLLNIYQALE